MIFFPDFRYRLCISWLKLEQCKRWIWPYIYTKQQQWPRNIYSYGIKTRRCIYTTIGPLSKYTKLWTARICSKLFATSIWWSELWTSIPVQPIWQCTSLQSNSTTNFRIQSSIPTIPAIHTIPTACHTTRIQLILE